MHNKAHYNFHINFFIGMTEIGCNNNVTLADVSILWTIMIA